MAQELNIHLEADGNVPLYRQIYEYIRGEIRSGSLTADERLPSTRALASYLQVARSTTELAYSQLLSEGYIRSLRGSGYFVNEIESFPELKLDDPMTSSIVYENDLLSADAVGAAGDIIDFSLRHTEMSVFPYNTWKRIMREVMADASAEMFSHSEPGGDLSLRTTIARYLHFSRGVHCRPEQIIVGAGNDYLLMLLRYVLGEGRHVAMENPTYLRAARIFLSFQYRICPVGMDRDGMLPESVAESGADLVYTMPAHQFPLGCVMPVARRTALLRWASGDPERYIIEDDYDSEFRYRGKPIPALQSLDNTGKVIYIGTFSKAIAPAIRVSYMILPEKLLCRYRERCWYFSSTVSRIDQRILNEFMHNGHFERHLNRMRSLYRARHDELTACLAPFRKWFSVRGTGTGLHLVLQCRREYLLREGFLKNTETDDSDEGIRGAAGGEVIRESAAAESGCRTPAGDSVCDSLAGEPDIRFTGREIERRLAKTGLQNGVRVYCLSDFCLPPEVTDNLTGDESAVKGGERTAGAGDESASNTGQRKTENKSAGFSKSVSPGGVVFLLGFGALEPEKIREGIRRLTNAWNIPDPEL